MASPADHRGRSVLITNARVWDGSTVSEPRQIGIRNGLIADAAELEDPDIVDAGNGVLIPGLIDCHIHINDENDLHKMAAAGITTALGMADWPVEKVKPLRDRVGLTDFRSAGLPATTRDSIHSKLLPLPAKDAVHDPREAAPFVDRRIAEGSDYIKVICDIPGPSQEALDALVVAAHERGKLVVAHAVESAPYAMAQAAKVDVVTHAPLDIALDEDAVRKMREEGRIAVPTLVQAYAHTGPPRIWPIARIALTKPWSFLAILQKQRQRKVPTTYSAARESVTALHRAGVPVLAGSDGYSEAGLPWVIPLGESLHRELELLVEAGMSAAEALRAATVLPAKYFNLPDRGSIEPGKRADLLLLGEDPTRDIKNTRSIQRVWCNGLEYKT